MMQRGWWIVILCAMAAINVSLMISYTTTPLYQTRARFLIAPDPMLDNTSQVLDGLDNLDQPTLAATFVEILMSQRIFDETAQNIGIDTDEEGNYERNAVVLPDSNVLELTVSGPDPTLAAALANGIGLQGITFIQDYYPVYDLDFLDKASVPSSPIEPTPKRSAAVSLMMGLAMGGVIAVLREYLHIPLDALRRRNITDEMSKAATRQYFCFRLEEELLINNPGYLSFGIVLLQGIEDLTETLPYSVMQDLQRRLSQTMQNELRGRDVVGKWDAVSFVFLLPGTPEVDATKVMERIHTALSGPQHIDQDEEPIYLKPCMAVVTNKAEETSHQLIDRLEATLRQTRIALEYKQNAPRSLANHTEFVAHHKESSPHEHDPKPTTTPSP